MMNSLFRSLFILTVSVLFVSCSPVLLYHPPVDENSPEEILDAHVAASLLKDKVFKFEDADGAITIEFSEYKRSGWMDELADKKDTQKTKYEKCVLRGLLKSVVKKKGNEDDAEVMILLNGTLPVLLVPFRQANTLFFMLTVDNEYLIEKNQLAPISYFLLHPASFVVKAEWTEKGWEIACVGFSEEKMIDVEDSLVMNSSSDILKMLNNPKYYDLPNKEGLFEKMLFNPVKSRK